MVSRRWKRWRKVSCDWFSALSLNLRKHSLSSLVSSTSLTSSFFMSKSDFPPRGAKYCHLRQLRCLHSQCTAVELLSEVEKASRGQPPLDHCLAWGEEELLPSLPLGHGGDCLWVRTGPSKYHNLTNFHRRYLQQGPGPCGGLQEEGHNQQHQCHPDHLDARAARIEPCYSLIRFQAVCGKSFAERVLRKEFAERVKLATD